MRQAILDGFGADAPGEDRFDSVLGVLCVLNVLAGNRSDINPRRSLDPPLGRFGFSARQRCPPLGQRWPRAQRLRPPQLLPRGYGQRTSGGRLMRIASTLPPVLRPNSVPRSWIRFELDIAAAANQLVLALRRGPGLPHAPAKRCAG